MTGAGTGTTAGAVSGSGSVCVSAGSRSGVTVSGDTVRGVDVVTTGVGGVSAGSTVGVDVDGGVVRGAGGSAPGAPLSGPRGPLPRPATGVVLTIPPITSRWWGLNPPTTYGASSGPVSGTGPVGSPIRLAVPPRCGAAGSRPLSSRRPSWWPTSWTSLSSGMSAGHEWWVVGTPSAGSVRVTSRCGVSPGAAGTTLTRSRLPSRSLCPGALKTRWIPSVIRWCTPSTCGPSCGFPVSR